MIRSDALALRLLGPVRLVGPTGTRSVSGAKPRAVLAALGLRLDQVVPVETLIEDLWSDRSPATARNTVQVYVSAVRRAVESARSPLRLDRVPGGYRLSGQRDQVDWLRFEALVGQARQRQRAGDPATASGLLRHASALWTGPPLHGLGDSPLGAAFRPRMETARTLALSDRIAADLALAETGAGPGLPALISELTELLRADPTDERFAAQLLQALHRSGRRSSALAVYADVRDRLQTTLGLHPGARLRQAYEAVLADDVRRPATPAPTGPAVPGRIGAARAGTPDAAGGLVGRRTELAAATTALADAGLLTLTGPPGVGKSWLAAAVADRLAGAGVEVARVRLDGITDPAEADRAVADALGSSREPAVEVVRYRALAAPVLVVLDHCDHLAGPVAQWCRAVLDGDGDVRVLATTARRLGVDGEIVQRLEPLALPAGEPVSAADALRSDAVALFCARARTVRPEFVLTDESVPDVLRICRAVEGLPLALELAAGRSAVLGLAELADRLDDQLRLLRPRSGASRSLEAVLTAATDRLPAEERALFAALSVFVDAVALRAAEAVAPTAATATIDLMQSLVDASLVIADVSATETRFRLLEPVRQHGRSLLTGTARRQALRRRADYLAALAATAAAEQRGADRNRWRERLDVARRDLYQELESALAAGRLTFALPLVADLWWWWSNRPWEGVGWYRRALRAADEGRPPDELRLRVLLAAAVIASYVSLPEAMDYAEEAQAVALRLGSRRGTVRAYQHTADIAHELGDLERARSAAERAWRLAVELKDAYASGRCTLSVAYNQLAAGDLVEARRWAREADRWFARAGDEEGRADARLLLAEVLVAQERDDAAEPLLLGVLKVFRAQRTDEQVARAATLLAVVADRRGRPNDAADLVTEAFDLHEAVRHPWAVAHDLELVAGICVRRGRAVAAASLLSAAAAVRVDAELAPMPRDVAVRAAIEAECAAAIGGRELAYHLSAGVVGDLLAATGLARTALA